MTGSLHFPRKPEHLDAHCDGDIVIARIRGPYDADVARYLESPYIAQVERFGYRLALLYAGETTTITPEARRLMSEWDALNQNPAAGAVVGASFAAKTVAGMLARAVSIITRKPVALVFFDTEFEARKWLDRQRVAFSELGKARIKA
jgi:hypothetical protein